MGNQAAKINRKIDLLLVKAYNYFWVEENISELSLENTSDVDEQEKIQKVIDNNSNHNNSKNDEKQSQCDENENQGSQILESIISLSITKEDFNQDKRKALIFLDSDINTKKICIDKENYIQD